MNLPQLTGEMLEKDVAIKISQRKCCEEEKCAVALLDDLNEASFLGLLEHKHVAHLIALTMARDYICMIFMIRSHIQNQDRIPFKRIQST